MRMFYQKLSKRRLYSTSFFGVLEYENDAEHDVQPWLARVGAFLFDIILLLLILLIVLLIIYLHCRFILPRLLAMASLFGDDKRVRLMPKSSDNSLTNSMASWKRRPIYRLD